MLNFKSFFKQLLRVILIPFLDSNSSAQIYVNAPLTTNTVSPGLNYNNTSITFNQGFSAYGSTGIYRFYINSDCAPLITAPNRNQNYVMTSTPRVPNYSVGTAGYSKCDVMQSIAYLEGLGRTFQTIQGSHTGIG